VTVIKVPAWAQPKVQYGICVVSRSDDKSDARRSSRGAEQGRAGEAATVGFLHASSREEEVVSARTRSASFVAVAAVDARLSAAADRRDLRRTPRPASWSTSSRTPSSRTRSSSR
jgi:hypothetical protein